MCARRIVANVRPLCSSYNVICHTTPEFMLLLAVAVQACWYVDSTDSPLPHQASERIPMVPQLFNLHRRDVAEAVPEASLLSRMLCPYSYNCGIRINNLVINSPLLNRPVCLYVCTLVGHNRFSPHKCRGLLCLN